MSTDLFDRAPKTRAFLPLMLTMIVIEAAGVFEQTMIIGAIPYLAGYFETDLLSVSWLITIFVLVGAVSAIVAGRLGDVFGRKKVLAILLVLSVIGSIISLVIGTFPALIVARALQGTSAGIVPLLVGLSREALEPKRVPVAVSIITATAVLTGGLGTFVGGLFVDAGQWHLMFAVSAGLALVALVLGALVLPRSRTYAGSREIDWLGAILLAPAVMAILFGLTTARSEGFLAPLVLTCLVGGVAVLLFWIWLELRIPSPMVNLRFLANPLVARTVIATVLLGLGMLSVVSVAIPVISVTPAELPIGVGLSASTFGLLTLVGAIIGFILSPWVGRLVARFGGGPVLVTGSVIGVVTYAPLLVPGVNKVTGVVIFAIMMGAVALTFLAAALYNLMAEAVPAENTSESIGVLQVIRNISIAVGTVIASTILSSSSVAETSAPTPAAWTWTIVYLIAILIAMTLVALTIGRRQPAGVAPEPTEAARAS
ncbi:MAG TPA: MFS transporter [Microbacterium sp.]|uniref:MFS transporter n=1 Tax=Microbacterium sp. TaxID=51671 RepID=UPI002B94D190|nr:MFS transporter [Microbacterium sp.]HWI31288.1 MFS transporter [Microbacterium sp.]